jgi:hypothetical protein
MVRWPSVFAPCLSWCIVTACMASQHACQESAVSRSPRGPGARHCHPSRHSALDYLRSNLAIALSSAPCASPKSRDSNIAASVNIQLPLVNLTGFSPFKKNLFFSAVLFPCRLGPTRKKPPRKEPKRPFPFSKRPFSFSKRPFSFSKRPFSFSKRPFSFSKRPVFLSANPFRPLNPRFFFRSRIGSHVRSFEGGRGARVGSLGHIGISSGSAAGCHPGRYERGTASTRPPRGA